MDECKKTIPTINDLKAVLEVDNRMNHISNRYRGTGLTAQLFENMWLKKIKT